MARAVQPRAPARSRWLLIGGSDRAEPFGGAPQLDADENIEGGNAMDGCASDDGESSPNKGAA